MGNLGLDLLQWRNRRAWDRVCKDRNITDAKDNDGRPEGKCGQKKTNVAALHCVMLIWYSKMFCMASQFFFMKNVSKVGHIMTQLSVRTHEWFTLWYVIRLLLIRAIWGVIPTIHWVRTDYMKVKEIYISIITSPMDQYFFIFMIWHLNGAKNELELLIKRTKCDGEDG